MAQIKSLESCVRCHTNEIMVTVSMTVKRNTIASDNVRLLGVMHMLVLQGIKWFNFYDYGKNLDENIAINGSNIAADGDKVHMARLGESTEKQDIS